MNELLLGRFIVLACVLAGGCGRYFGPVMQPAFGEGDADIFSHETAERVLEWEG